MRTRRIVVWMAVAMAVAGSAVVAQEAAPTNTVITSRQLTFDYGRMIAVFDGDVVVADPEIRMTSDKLTVIFEGSNEVKSVTAVGRVRLVQAEKRAQADMAVYMARQGEILLTGNAQLFRDRDTVMGDSITFWLNDNRMICRPGRLILHTDGDKPRDGAAFGVLPDLRRPAGGRP